MDLSQFLLLVFALLLVLLNGFFVAAEFAIVKVRRTRIEQLVREGRAAARMARRLIDNLDAYLSATQLGITIASLGLGWVGEPAIARLIEPWLGELGMASPAAVHGTALVVAFVIITFLHVVLGELAPKSLAIQRSEPVTLLTAWPLHGFYLLLYPAIVALNGTANLLLRALGLPPAREAERAHSPAELHMLVESSAAQGLLNTQQRRLVANALALSQRCVREIMVPRPDMHCLFADRPLAENIETVRRHAHTRYPLARGEIEQIVGMVHVKDLTTAASAASLQQMVAALGADALEKLARPIPFVPEVATIDRVLRMFQRGGIHMAIVVDEWGGVVGLVTLEDVLEELVGDIRDEFDASEAERLVRVGPDGVALVDGAIPLAEVRRRFGIEAPDATVDTLGGYVMQRLGRLARVGDVVEVEGWRIEVVRMRRLRITRLRLVPPPTPSATPAEG
ncbi:MAG: membrane protein [Planctomycetota bacterium]|nr:MAG: membrane protein [Planctomycetota bacterium]